MTKLGNLFPILFVTVACGAVSGFHSLVSSGTSSKTVANEKDMLKVGYGAMVLESLLAVLASLCSRCGSCSRWYRSSGNSVPDLLCRCCRLPGDVRYSGLCSTVLYDHVCICPGSNQSGFRGTYRTYVLPGTVQLLDDMEHAEGWRKLLCNKYFSTVVTLACGFILTKIGYSNIWPLFGSANQLLSALVLITLCVFLKVTGT